MMHVLIAENMLDRDYIEKYTLGFEALADRVRQYTPEWAAHISPMVLYGVAMGGFVVRLIVFTIALVLLNTVSWFSPMAFALTLVPAMIGLLVVEARALSGRLQTDMWAFEDPRR